MTEGPADIRALKSLTPPTDRSNCQNGSPKGFARPAMAKDV
jgi:hypothetical protein